MFKVSIHPNYTLLYKCTARQIALVLFNQVVQVPPFFCFLLSAEAIMFVVLIAVKLETITKYLQRQNLQSSLNS